MRRGTDDISSSKPGVAVPRRHVHVLHGWVYPDRIVLRCECGHEEPYEEDMDELPRGIRAAGDAR